jgi:hypothetical protein
MGSMLVVPRMPSVPKNLRVMAFDIAVIASEAKQSNWIAASLRSSQ